MVNQHKLVVNKAHILIDDKCTENLATEEVDRRRLCHKVARAVEDKGSLVNDNPIGVLAGMVQLSDRRDAGGQAFSHVADIERLPGISRGGFNTWLTD